VTPTLIVPKTQHASVIQDGERVLLVIDGRLVADLPPEAAINLGRALITKGRLAEEIVHRDRVIADQALLFRAGVGIPLIVNPALRAEAGKEAAWNSELRRALPNRTDAVNKTAGQVYMPAVWQDPPKED
jgi:hypothetical protein